MTRFWYTALLNICFLMIPAYLIYDGMTSIQFNASSVTAVLPRKHVRPSDVIINTYMRAGSSFVGKMLGFRDDTFYVYEPLWTFHRYGYYRGMRDVCWTFSPGCSPNSDVYMANRFLKSIYDCQFTKFSKHFKENIHQKMSGPSWNIYRRCRANKGAENVASCIRNAVAVCKNSKHRVTKVLRMSLDIMQIFLKERPHLKVVHLFRDPRAMINSHFQTSWSPLRRGGSEKQIVNAARAICDRMSRDIEIGEKLLEIYPERFKMIQYEDFDDPSSKINILYKFLGMAPAEETQQYISNPETGARPGTSRGNHPFKYRTTLDWSTVQLIDQHCYYVYDKLGYANYSDEIEYRNLSVSGIKSKLSYTL